MLLNGNLGILSNAFLFYINILAGIPMYYSDVIFMGRSSTGGFFPRHGAIARCMKLLTVLKVNIIEENIELVHYSFSTLKQIILAQRFDFSRRHKIRRK